jgi:hypothetical protein
MALHVRRLLLLSVMFPLLAIASESEDLDYTGWAFNLENDGFWLKNWNEDRNYTMGVTWQTGGKRVAEWKISRPLQWVDSLKLLDGLRISDADAEAVTHRLTVGVSAFTPDNLALSTPDPTDRPYASMLYADVQRRALNEDGNVAMSTELSLGVYGLSLAKGFQRWIHRQRQDSRGIPAIPEGWHNQISDGGEPTFRYTVRAQRLLGCKRYFDTQVTADGSVGYYTNVGAGLAVRFGLIKSPWWGFDAQKITASELPTYSEMPNIAEAAAGSAGTNAAPNSTLPCQFGASGRWEAYVWAGANAHLWGYNGMMQGQFRHSSVRVSADDVERLVYNFMAGATIGYKGERRWYSFGMSVMGRSAESDIVQRRSHTWGGVYLSVSPVPEK